MTYPDKVKLYTYTFDGYGDKSLTLLGTVRCTFIRRAGYGHSDGMDYENTTSAVYLDINNKNVIDNKNSLENMYICLDPFTEKDWYRISTVNIAERKLLNNKIDNIYCRLEKLAGAPDETNG